MVACFRDTYTRTSRKYVSTESKIRSFQELNKKKLFSTSPFIDLKNSDIFTQTLQKQPYPTPVLARFRDTYAPTFRKYVSTEPKKRPYN